MLQYRDGKEKNMELLGYIILAYLVLPFENVPIIINYLKITLDFIKK
jgi:hypothetical protein